VRAIIDISKIYYKNGMPKAYSIVIKKKTNGHGGVFIKMET